MIFGSILLFLGFILFYNIFELYYSYPLVNYISKTFLYLHFVSWVSLSALYFLPYGGYNTCHNNCKSHPFSSSETSFEFNLLEETRVSSHNDVLHILATNHQPGPTFLPCLTIFIYDKDR